MKRVAMGVKPSTDPVADGWVKHGRTDAGDEGTRRSTPYIARLTIDVTPALRGRLKVRAFQNGITVADMVRALLEREFPEGVP